MNTLHPSERPSPLLELRGIDVGFGGIRALQDVSLDVAPGQVLGVIGPNGAGKTTLFNVACGFVRPDAGDVVWRGEPLRRLAPHHLAGLGIARTLQGLGLFDRLTVLDNVMVGADRHGRTGFLRALLGLASGSADERALRERARAVLDELGIADVADRLPPSLPYAVRKKVALARALVAEPDLLLLDEPFSGLDVGVAAALRIELSTHLADFAGVTLMVTHDALDALTLADAVVVLEAGRVAQQGAPHEVAAQPRTDHVARLVGLNVLRRPDQGFLAFRPADVTVSTTEPHTSARLVWRGRVAGLTPHGDAVRVQVDTRESAGTDLLADVTGAASVELGLAPGAEVWLSVKATAARDYGAAPP